jgi:hypothetical protein
MFSPICAAAIAVARLMAASKSGGVSAEATCSVCM